MSHASCDVAPQILLGKTARAVYAVILGVLAGAAHSAERRPLAVVDSIERTTFTSTESDSQTISYSRDGTRYLVTTTTGDVARNGIWMRFFTGQTTSLTAAAAKNVATLFSHAYGDRPVTTDNRPRWLQSNEHVAFRWEDGRGVQQVFLLDLKTGELRQRTHHASDVQRFALSPDGSALIYTAFGNHPGSRSSELARSGFAVASADGPTFAEGKFDGWINLHHVELFVSRDWNEAPCRLPTPSRWGAGDPFEITFSSDGRRAIVALPVNPPSTWARYENALYQSWLRQAQRRTFTLPLVTQLHVIDVQQRTVRPLWNALRHFGASVIWSPDAESVAVGPTFLPPDDPTNQGLVGDALAVIDVRTGKHQTLSTNGVGGQLQSPRTLPVAWRGSILDTKTVATGVPPIRHYCKFKKGRWLSCDTQVVSASEPVSPRVKIEIRENLNSPPALYAVDTASRTERLILDPDPVLRAEFLLGDVQLVRWSDPDGRSWAGRLYLPVGRTAAERIALVIQLKGFSDTAFSLLGSDHYPSTFVAQVLANRGIATLQMENDFAPQTSPEEPRIATMGILAAIRYLSDRGIVDEARIGLSGFSRTGWYVEYAIAHADFRFAAALSADHINASFTQDTFRGGIEEFSLDNGGEPFGEGLAAWLENTPGFSADRVQTPLRIQAHGVGKAIGQWELFSRLVRLRKPVELYIVPSADKAAHNLQNPGQQFASREGAVDWFDFWLNGHEDRSVVKSAQYERWRALREQQEAALKQPRRPRLRWTATPLIP